VASKLEQLKEPVQLCGPTGRVLGRFFPEVDMSEWEPVSDDITDEELDRRLNSNETRFTTAEVLAYLEQLDAQGDRQE
jgi:hypothetical protein